jgi:hypothetical protein
MLAESRSLSFKFLGNTSHVEIILRGNENLIKGNALIKPMEIMH